MYVIMLAVVIAVAVSNYWFQWGDISFFDYLTIAALVFGFAGVIEAIEKLGKKEGGG